MLKRVPIILFLIAIFFFYFKDESFDSNKITIGMSLPKTGIISSWGDSVLSGANAYFQYINDNKILGKNFIEIIALDDKYEPELTIDNLNQLIYKDNVFTLFGFVGTPTVKRVLPIIENEEIPFFAPFTGASFLRKNKQNIVNFRTSYRDEIENLIYHLHNKNGLEEFSVFYQNDDYGEEGYVSLIKSLKSRNLNLIAEGSYKRNTLSISHAFHEIKNAKPEAIIMIGAYKANALFIQKAKEDKNLKDAIFCNISFGDANAMIEELKNLNVDTKNILFSQVVPNYMDNLNMDVKEYQELMKKYYPNKKLGFISFEAFLSAKVLIDAISRIEGNRTREKFLEKIKLTPNNLISGLNLNYSNSQLSNNVYLFEYIDDKFKEIK